MKKLFCLILVTMAIAGFSAAQEKKPIGITADLRAEMGNLKAEKSAENGLTLVPSAAYAGVFLGGALNLNASLKDSIDFKTGLYQEKVYQIITMGEGAGYNLFFPGGSILSFLLANTNVFYTPSRNNVIAPIGFNNVTGTVKPGIKFGQRLNFGIVYAQADLAAAYMTDLETSDSELGLNLSLGWLSPFGLTVEAVQYNGFKDDSISGDNYRGTGYNGLDVTINYLRGYLQAMLQVETEKDFKDIVITPALGYVNWGFTFYGGCQIGNINSRGNFPMSLTAFVGMKYSF